MRTTSTFFHVAEGALAQGRADVLAPVCFRDGEDFNIAATLGWVDPPGHVADDRTVTGLGNGHVLAGFRVVQCRDRLSCRLESGHIRQITQHASVQGMPVVLPEDAIQHHFRGPLGGSNCPVCDGDWSKINLS
jgi:hypothetical protein